MADLPLPEDVRALLARPNPCTVTTLRSDGAPVSVATWYLLDPGADRILLNMDDTRVRLQHLHRDPRVSLTILAEDDWYTHVSLLGRVTEITADPGLADIDRLSQHYRQQPYPNRDAPRTSAWVDIDRWHGWGEMRAD